MEDRLALLAQSATAGDPRALDALCQALQDPLYRLAVRVLGEAEDARDATQEILLQIVTHLSQFRGDSKLLTWAYTVATRHLLRRKSRDAQRRRIEDVVGRIDLGLSLTEPTSDPEGDTRVAELETRMACTQAMLFALSQEERIAIVIAELLGADDATGATLCGVSVQTYRKRLSRGRATLRPVLEQRCGLANPALPCRCRRQARAKQLAGPIALRWSHLPVADAARLEAAHHELGAVRRLGSVFEIEPAVAAPSELWQEVRRGLGGLLAE